ncbi:LLM class flavin-dependent oxidoreductase [Variovorax atrisoli]|uniref:LLM class flavin-dependent oxidoreductase n=1 Tax=Variovorax atrisoli TaxID=3394203 RepID=UPI003AACA57C
MEFGVFILAQQRGYHQTSQQVINNSIEQTVAAEQAGFNTAWYAEHHFNNYSLSPSPLMMVAHMAAKTKRIRLGTAVCILPLTTRRGFLRKWASSTRCPTAAWSWASARATSSSSSNASA